MRKKSFLFVLGFVLLPFFLLSCGKKKHNSTSIDEVAIKETTPTYTVGGTISGLNGALVLQNNLADNLTLSADGSFTFSTEISDLGAYAVTILTQPTRQICSISKASGTIAGALITDISVTCLSNKYFFITNSTFTGDLGGIAGADAKCNSDANKPNSSSYKAFIVDGTNRVACTTASCSTGTIEHTDWVLIPNTTYTRIDSSTPIATTDANGLFTFPFTNTYIDTDDTSFSIWTGLNADPTGSSNWVSAESVFNCTGWVETADTYRGIVGGVTLLDFNAISSTGYFLCLFTSNHLGCAEQ